MKKSPAKRRVAPKLPLRRSAVSLIYYGLVSQISLYHPISPCALSPLEGTGLPQRIPERHNPALLPARPGWADGRKESWLFEEAAIAGAAAKDQEVFQLANLIARLATGIVLTGHSRQYEAEADAFGNIYFEANELGHGRPSFRNVLKKLQYHQDFYDPESTGSSFMSTPPDIDARIDAVQKSTMRAFGPEEIFYGYDRDGELVATLTFQGQRCYTGLLNKDDAGLQMVALVETTSVLGDKDKIKEIRINTKGRTIKLDNKEDTEVLPNDAVRASFVSKDQRALVDEIEGIELQLKNVTSWKKAHP